MNRFAILAAAALILSACSHDPEGIRLTHDVPASPAAMTSPRTEPVFYNGKVYRLNVQPDQGGYGLSISGMAPTQQKDAVAVATSAMHQFACKDSQKIGFSGQPSYASGLWQFHGNCG